jgi:N-ethylmaleimide reductase
VTFTMTATTADDALFQPIQLGDITLANRMAMAPLTRNRAAAGNVPGPLAVEYYTQRASVGLVIAEATQVSAQAQGYDATPGLHTPEQIAGWKKVTDAVHAKGGKIFVQLWHTGRVSHTRFQPGQQAPVAPSALKATAARTYVIGQGFVETSEPRALATEEIAGVVNDFRTAAANAIKAGFDGIELHAAHGYLIDAFLRSGSNQRTDQYGGSIENRTRIVVEVVEAVTKVWGGNRVGIRLSPLTKFADIGDSNPEPVYTSLIEQINPYKLSYIHVIEGETQGERHPAGGFDLQKLRRAFNGLYMANNNYDLKLAIEAREKNLADLICFGRPFISNPDLVERLRVGAPLATPDPNTFYAGDAHGYIDYPAL